MHALAAQCIQVCRQGCDEGFTFAGFHLADSSLMKNYSAQNLNGEMTHTENPVGGLSANRKSIGQDILQGFSLFKPCL